MHVSTLLFAAALCACGGTNVPSATGEPLAPGAKPARWIPSAGESYQIQYDGKLDLSVDADIYDLDVFDTPSSVVAQLHTMNRRVMCYVDVGTWEKWRPDAGKFPKSVLGNTDGHWKGERWLDVRQTAILQPIMARRLQLCKSKGFNGVDPDNLDGFENKTGFPITYAEQLSYDAWVAKAAHARGLTADQKGDNDQVKDLVKVYDFAVVEQCYAQGWCKQFAVYTQLNRLVVDVEYGLSQNRFQTKACPDTARYNETAILKKLQLTAWLVTCSNR
ncbi:MAG TPA: endo alpha-1,4 polygalactosaminidase [Candidatus Baltobacteraceae bacterium]|nr:endo alpha-1,4 polygalactosaminidase [Candidatus Baltobacteraceae bacterium]